MANFVYTTSVMSVITKRWSPPEAAESEFNFKTSDGVGYYLKQVDPDELTWIRLYDHRDQVLGQRWFYHGKVYDNVKDAYVVAFVLREFKKAKSHLESILTEVDDGVKWVKSAVNSIANMEPHLDEYGAMSMFDNWQHIVSTSLDEFYTKNDPVSMKNLAQRQVNFIDGLVRKLDT